MDMGLVSAGQSAIGTGLQLVGGIFASKEAKRLRDAINQIANTPGLDIAGATGEGIAGWQTNLPGAAKASGAYNVANQANLQALMEGSVPGYGSMKKQQLGTAQSYLRGEIPADVQQAIQRSSAAKALSGGFSGSGMQGALTARDFGLTSMNLMDRGSQMAGNLTQNYRNWEIGSPVLAQMLAGPSPTEYVSRRGDERTQRIGLQMQAAGVPGSSGVWGNILQQAGARLQGAGDSGGGMFGWMGHNNSNPSGRGEGYRFGDNWNSGMRW